MSGRYISSLLLALLLITCRPNDGIDVIPYGSFSQFHVLHDRVNGEDVVIVGEKGRELIVAYKAILNGILRTFKETSKFLPIVMEDTQGNEYDIFGTVVRGPDQGSRLDHVNAGTGFWFTFSSRYPGLDVFEGPKRTYNIDLTPNNDWLVPTQYVAQGAAFDNIMALDDIAFQEYIQIKTDPDQSFYLNGDSRVIVVKMDEEIRVYPIAILNWHEIINDEINGIPVSVTYSPLTGTSRVWRRPEIVDQSTFGVTGFVYNSNLIAFDRSTLSYWMQLEGLCVYGPLAGSQLNMIPHIETTWATWRSIEDTPLVVDDSTGVNRDYSMYPYGDYQFDHNLINYPIAVDDDRLPRKERVFCLEIDGVARVYTLDNF